MVNKIFLLGLFLLSVANVKAQTLTQTDSLTMETMLHNLPEVMVKGSRPIVKAERGMLSYNMPLLLKQLPADNAYEALTRIPGISDATGSISFSGNPIIRLATIVFIIMTKQDRSRLVLHTTTDWG